MNSFGIAHSRISRSVLAVPMPDLSLIPNADQANNRAILRDRLRVLRGASVARKRSMPFGRGALLQIYVQHAICPSECVAMAFLPPEEQANGFVERLYPLTPGPEECCPTLVGGDERPGIKARKKQLIRTNAVIHHRHHSAGLMLFRVCRKRPNFMLDEHGYVLEAIESRQNC